MTPSNIWQHQIIFFIINQALHQIIFEIINYHITLNKQNNVCLQALKDSRELLKKDL